MQFFVYSRGAIEMSAPHDVPHAIISITSRPDDVARLPVVPACRGVLRLSFADADAPSAAHPERELFAPAHAALIWDFVQRHRDEVERILVHCDAGLCRSPAVAAALALVLNGSDAEFFKGRYFPNMLVYRTLLETRPEDA